MYSIKDKVSHEIFSGGQSISLHLATPTGKGMRKIMGGSTPWKITSGYRFTLEILVRTHNVKYVGD